MTIIILNHVLVDLHARLRLREGHIPGKTSLQKISKHANT